MAGDVKAEFYWDDKQAEAAGNRMITKLRAQKTELQKLVRTSQAAHRSQQTANRRTRTSYDELGQRIKTGILGPLMALAAPAGALAMIRSHYDAWLAQTRQLGAESRKMARSFLTLATLQEPGMRGQATREAAWLAKRFGFEDADVAGDVVQSMQSTWGGYEEGKLSAATVFAAANVGIPATAGKELESFGFGAKLKPGDALRMAYIAGKQSSRDPAALANVAPAVPYFEEDPAWAFGIGAALTNVVRPGELGTFTRRAADALSMESALGDWYTQHGVGKGATRPQRFEALLAAGIDTEDELSELGLTETRERRGLGGALRNVDVVRKTLAAIAEQNVPGLFGVERAAIESELPTLREERKLRELQIGAEIERARGPSAKAGTAEEYTQTVYGKAAHRLGLHTGGLGTTVDEQGRMDWFGYMRACLWEEISRGPNLVPVRHQMPDGSVAIQTLGTSRLDIEAQRIRIEEESTDYLKEIAQSTSALADQAAKTAEAHPDKLSNPTSDN